MLAILDWEMSTLGDPLTDVGMVAVYWTEVGEFMWRNRESPQPHRANAGFPSVDVILERYEASSGRHLDNIDFYRTLATFKLSVITEGAHARIAKSGGDTTGAKESSEALASMALDYSAKLA
jgi:aminoglycoside phosphotransferase (APT) family kinase protein